MRVLDQLGAMRQSAGDIAPAPAFIDIDDHPRIGTRLADGMEPRVVAIGTEPPLAQPAAPSGHCRGLWYRR
jgi:hypothetical protein